MSKLTNITVTDISQVFCVSFLKERYTEIRNRKMYGFTLCEKGQLVYTHNGKTFVSDEHHALILPQGQTYCLHGKSGMFPLVNFTCLEPLCNTILSFPITDNNVLLKEFAQLQSLSLFEENRAKMFSVFYDMLHHVATQGASHGLLQPAIRYIEAHYGDPNIQNEQLAAECKISEVYLRKLFAEQFKTSPKQFVLDVRLQKAKQLLAERSMKVCAVAEQCGFASTHHFCRYFKKKVGLTPTEYAAQQALYFT